MKKLLASTLFSLLSLAPLPAQAGPLPVIDAARVNIRNTDMPRSARRTEAIRLLGDPGAHEIQSRVTFIYSAPSHQVVTLHSTVWCYAATRDAVQHYEEFGNTIGTWESHDFHVPHVGQGGFTTVEPFGSDNVSIGVYFVQKTCVVQLFAQHIPAQQTEDASGSTYWAPTLLPGLLPRVVLSLDARILTARPASA